MVEVGEEARQNGGRARKTGLCIGCGLCHTPWPVYDGFGTCYASDILGGRTTEEGGRGEAKGVPALCGCFWLLSLLFVCYALENTPAKGGLRRMTGARKYPKKRIMIFLGS